MDFSFKSSSDETARKEYADFEERVKRTVFLCELSPAVTESVVRKAFGQFGEVVGVEFIPNYCVPYNIPSSALVEMKEPKQAANVVNELTGYPFMMSGMPRPVRAQAAVAEMFADRPPPPGREIQVRWVSPSDPDFDAAKKTKQLCKQHIMETLALTKVTHTCYSDFI